MGLLIELAARVLAAAASMARCQQWCASARHPVKLIMTPRLYLVAAAWAVAPGTRRLDRRLRRIALAARCELPRTEGDSPRIGESWVDAQRTIEEREAACHVAAAQVHCHPSAVEPCRICCRCVVGIGRCADSRECLPLCEHGLGGGAGW